MPETAPKPPRRARKSLVESAREAGMDVTLTQGLPRFNPIKATAEPLPPPAIPTCYETLSKLRGFIARLSAQPWHAVVMLNPLFDEKPDSPFVLKMRQTREFVGQYEANQSDQDLLAIATEVCAIWESNNQPITQPQSPLLDADGKVAGDPRVEGKFVEVPLANGKLVKVVPRTVKPVESERNEDRRVQRDIDRAIEVEIEYNGDWPIVVVYNGVEQVLQPGINFVKKPFADVYRASRQEQGPPLDLDGRRRKYGLSVGLPSYDEVEGFLMRSQKG